jgi:D-glycero-alpha-D-manno-heptose-7-phosphate kinase
MQVFSAQAPTRIDLAGGTLDLWPIHRLLPHKGTVNIALSLFATTTLEVGGSKGTFELVSTDQNASVRGSYEEVLAASVLPLHREMLRNLWSLQLPALRLTTSCQSPQGAGLGGSSSLAITIASALAQARNALLGEDLPSKDHLVAQAQDIEASCLATPTGIQDYWGAVNGGITLISYPPGKPQVEVFLCLKCRKLKNRWLFVLVANLVSRG